MRIDTICNMVSILCISIGWKLDVMVVVVVVIVVVVGVQLYWYCVLVFSSKLKKISITGKLIYWLITHCGGIVF